MKELILEASVDNLDEVLDYINENLERHNCSPDLQSLIDTAVEEVFMNVANYAYKPANGNVAVCISIGKEVVIRFEDAGEPYNPLEQAAPDLDKPLMERKIGGLGVFLVRRLMDKVEYTRVGDKNVLVMTKEITNHEQ